MAEDSFVGYSELVSALADRNSELITEVEDHELRRGVQLIDMSSGRSTASPSFVRLRLLGAVTGDRRLADPAEISRGRRSSITAALNNHYAHPRPRPRALRRRPATKLEVESEATGIIEMGPQHHRDRAPSTSRRCSTGHLARGRRELLRLPRRRVGASSRPGPTSSTTWPHARSRWYLAAAALVDGRGGRRHPGWCPGRSCGRSRTSPASRSPWPSATCPTAVRRVLETPVGEDVEVPELAPVTVSRATRWRTWPRR